jgi:protein ImuB
VDDREPVLSGSEETAGMEASATNLSDFHAPDRLSARLCRCEVCMKFAAIFVPDFPVEAVVRAAPELRGQGVAVVEGTPPLLNVVACNQRAREAGVEIGMTKVEAEGRLAAHAAASGGDPVAHVGVENPSAGARRDTAAFMRDPRPSLPGVSKVETGWQVRRRSPAQEMAAHAALIDCACAFSPRVEDNSATPDTVVLDLEGLERLFGQPPKIARDLARRASELGLKSNVAVAGNAEAAVHAARGFAGVTVIPPGEEAERLGALPVEVLLEGAGDLQRSAEMLDTLSRWGIRTFRALAALPESAVRQRLGELGIRLQKLARGEGARPLVPAEPPMIFQEAAELEYPVTLLEALSFLLNNLLEQMCARLNARALATQEIMLVLGTERYADESVILDSPICKRVPGAGDFREPGWSTQGLGQQHAQSETDPEGHQCSAQKYTLRLPVPMLDAKVFLKLLQLELRTKPPGAPVNRVFLKAEPVRPRFTQSGLFLPTAPEPEKLEVLLARINSVVSPTDSVSAEARATGSRTGEAGKPDELRVGAVELLDTHRPDTFRMKKFAPEPASDRDLSASIRANPCAGNGKPANNITGPRTALRRFRPPLPVRVVVRDGRPESIVGFEFKQIVWAAGPWRESGDWWTGEPWTREVWDVVVASEDNTVVCRLCRDAARDEWSVEAQYD